MHFSEPFSRILAVSDCLAQGLQTKADVQEHSFAQGPFGIILRKSFSQFRIYPLERVSKEVPGHEIGDLQRALL